MSQEQSALVHSLKRQHHLLWLLLGLGFSVWLVFQLDQGGLTSILFLLGLLATYYAAGQWTARQVTRQIAQWEETRQSEALMSSTLKVGLYASMLSALFHLLLLGIANGSGALKVVPHVQVSILVRAAIFPFLACLGAACTASDSAWPESPGIAPYAKNSSVPTSTD